jgi:sugar diacid utilization regulator
VRRLLTAAPEDDSDQQRSLQVIDLFDRLTDDGSSLEQMAGAADELLGARSHIYDASTDSVLSATDEGSAPVGFGRAVMSAAIETQAPPHEAFTCRVKDICLRIMDLAGGRGRLGVVWTDKPAPDLSAIDDLVLERLARSASSLLQRQRREATLTSPPLANENALEDLLVGRLEPDEAKAAARAVGLVLSRQYVVVAHTAEPRGAVSDAVSASLITNVFARMGIRYYLVTVANAPLLAAEHHGLDDNELHGALTAAEESGWRLCIGFGDPAEPAHLHVSARQARQALALGSDAATGSIVRFDNLGALKLLATLPLAEIDHNEDVSRLLSVAETKKGVSDLALLEAYCDTGSLRRTAELFHFHHSSVDYRLRCLEARLGFTLSTQNGRLRALVAAKLAKLASMSDLGATQSRT